MPNPDHREQAVEALAEIMHFQSRGSGWTRADDHDRKVFLLAAANELKRLEPHFRRMFFERFKEAMLSEEATKATRETISCDWQEYGPTAASRRALQAALNQAERLMEEGDTDG